MRASGLAGLMAGAALVALGGCNAAKAPAPGDEASGAASDDGTPVGGPSGGEPPFTCSIGGMEWPAIRSRQACEAINRQMLGKGCFAYQKAEDIAPGRPGTVVAALDSADRCTAAIDVVQRARPDKALFVETHHITVATRVFARLMPEDPDVLEVKPLDAERRRLDEERMPVWHWQVSARQHACKAYAQTLDLVTGNVVTVSDNGASEDREMINDPLPKAVTVQVNALDCAQHVGDVVTDWKTVLVSIMAALVAVLVGFGKLREAVLGLFRRKPKGGKKED